MGSDVIDALNAAKILFTGLAPADVTPLQNVYVYPDDFMNDYSTPDVDTVPFMILQERVGATASVGNLSSGSGNRGLHLWAIEPIVYLTATEATWPSAAAARAEYQHRNWDREINDLLSRNRTLNGTVFDIGEKRGNGYIFADLLKDHEQWNQRPGWSIRFLIQVIQIYDRGGD